MVHYMAARNMEQQVSFVLDIGGQDMKAIFADNGAITRIEVNEACSSGCGSFISTFAQPWIVRSGPLPGRLPRPVSMRFRHTLHRVHELEGKASAA